jgi:putative tryptophan/tyrosine transport system substrate-binding protein
MNEVRDQKSEIGKSERTSMAKKIIFLALCSLLLAPCSAVDAQQPTKIPRIGFLAGTKPAPVAARVAAFRQGLRELGYVEGKNIIVEYRYAEGKADRERELAAELARLKVDVIVSAGPTVTRALKEATSTIPIVMGQDGNPVASGLVASLARPGGNITGLSNLSPELSGKRLELLKEIVPKLSLVTVIGSSNEPDTPQILKEMELAAGALKVKLQYLDVLSSKDIETAFQAAAKARADGVVMLGSVVFNTHRIQIVELAAKSRLPATYTRPEYVEDGGLMTYGPSINDLFRRAATYVDKILKGAKPADLPVEQPTKFEFVINLKTAKQIGLTIPQRVLGRADKVIK